MNDDHAEAVLAYARHYGGIDSPSEACMIEVQSNGMLLRVDGRDPHSVRPRAERQRGRPSHSCSDASRNAPARRLKQRGEPQISIPPDCSEVIDSHGTTPSCAAVLLPLQQISRRIERSDPMRLVSDKAPATQRRPCRVTPRCTGERSATTRVLCVRCCSSCARALTTNA